MNRVQRVAIIGAGTMGRRIAFGCVVRGVEACLFDTSADAPKVAVKQVRALVQRHERKRRVKARTLNPAMKRLTTADSLQECVSDADLVMETVPENVELKKRVLEEIGRHAAPGVFVGTNTSSIPGSWLAPSTGRPEKFFNANFGGPDDRKVEVMGHPGTAAETLAAARGWIRSLGLIPIVVKRENMGYATNRVWRAVKKEVLHLVEGGYMSAEDIDRGWMLDWGTPCGPCGLMDKIGLDVVRDIEMIYFRESGDPADEPPPLLGRMIREGKLGLKSGVGFYKYPRPAYEQRGWLEGERTARHQNRNTKGTSSAKVREK